jgi:hypothetical protein
MGVKGKPRRRRRKRKDGKEANVFPSGKAERNELGALGKRKKLMGKSSCSMGRGFVRWGRGIV